MLLYLQNENNNMYISRQEPDSFLESEEKKTEDSDSSESMLIAENSEDVLLHWKTREFEILKRDKKWYIYGTIILLAIVIYALFTNGLVMAITFILIGMAGYIYINKEPRILDFMITKDGLIAGREIYDFDNLKSFWIFYDNDVRAISLHTKSHLIPYIHIPIGDEDPVKIREILTKYIAEEKQEQGIVETVERLLKL